MHLIPKQTWVDRIYHTVFVSIIFPPLFHLSSDTMILLLCNFTFCRIIHFTLLQFQTEQIGIFHSDILKCTRYKMKFHSYKTRDGHIPTEMKILGFSLNFLFDFYIKNSPATGWGGLSHISFVKICPKEDDLNYQLCLICQTGWLWMRFMNNWSGFCCDIGQNDTIGKNRINSLFWLIIKRS